jgi:bis(5'-nucleosidyl)-tetraphosphatase
MHYRRDTSAGVVVFHRQRDQCRFLLLLSRLTKRPLWEFPKGGVDPGETALRAALRELHEETGLAGPDVRLVPGFERREAYRFTIPGQDGRTLVHKRVTYFLAEAFRDDVNPSTAEIHEFAWLTPDEAIRRLRYTDRRRILREAAQAIGCPVRV